MEDEMTRVRKEVEKLKPQPGDILVFRDTDFRVCEKIIEHYPGCYGVLVKDEQDISILTDEQLSRIGLQRKEE